MTTVLLGALVVVPSVMLAIIALALTYHLVPVSVREPHNTATGTIYAALYVMYGISVGFSLFLVWQQFEAARQTVEREAGALERIYKLAEQFPEPGQDRIQDFAVSYARAVIKEEWPMMAHGQSSPRTGELANELGESVRRVDPENDTQDAIYAEILARLDDLTENRSLRLLEVREGMPAMLWFVLVAGAAILVAFTYLFGIRTFWLHAVAVGALTTVVAFVLFTIGVLDHPFDGEVRVGPDAFEILLKEIGSKP